MFIFGIVAALLCRATRGWIVPLAVAAQSTARGALLVHALTNDPGALLAGTRLPEGWMLSGGLDPASVGAALARTGARAVDVSSGVESGPGVKDPERIAAFVKAVRGR